ncbi:aminoglycoside N3'-acetyltransferase [Rivularia sp. PCC 7116]|uniref:aminoglycoside N(3)-acetyltransferase n=1 Tax=Rivularia sp. PCC 7116 TaxID=373994 RepID=UPI00029ECB8A|nr:AAC(3) family N-acetyltransferase [Rivularia sp. PCC 7116]AFY55919.1 aminoglycoside N3'-acetyltransferase [Rivularia sp. PCC 7116]
MAEAEAISKSQLPRTRKTLTQDLINAGLTPGITVIVHSSLSSLGWVCGGAVTVVQALIDVVTSSGTLVMPTHSNDYSDPELWQNPPVPTEWWQTIRDTMPAYDARITPTRNMGKIVEVFRTWENVLRSSHPNFSFAAWGNHAEDIIKNHSFNYSLGEESPLARLYDLNGYVLLLGTGYDTCTTFHLAEYRKGDIKTVNYAAPILEAGKRVWKTYLDIDFDTESFVDLGEAFEKTGCVKNSKVGSADTKFFAVRDAVDFGVDWLKANRK